jgi:undecaprenyl-diphosphatase
VPPRRSIATAFRPGTHCTPFTWIVCSYHAAWAPYLVGYTLLIALSRVILGLHYSTDVAAGAVIGGALGMASLVIVGPLVDVMARIVPI